MSEVPVGQPDAPMHLDVCRRCHLVWMDRNEEHQLPKAEPAPPEPTQPPLSEEGRRLLALWKVGELREQYELTSPPPEGASLVAGWLGFPVVRHASKTERLALATWVLAVSSVLASLWAWRDPFIGQELSFLPADPWRYGGITFATSFLLHAGVPHLIANGYFLLVLGPHVEQLLGSLRYLLLLLVATVLGDAAHALVDVRSDVPLVGASGGLSGAIVFYALAFPHARVRLFFVHRWLARGGLPPWRWVMLSARAALVLWIASQAVGIANQVAGLSVVSSAAHIGGAAAGAGAWWLLRR